MSHYNFLADAIAWRNRGIACMPIKYGSKYWMRGFELPKTMPSLRQLSAWFRSGYMGDELIQMAVIADSGLCVLDFDAFPPYVKWHVAHPDLATTYTVKSSRGAHVYIIVCDDIPPYTKAAERDICIKHDGHPVTAEHSLHKSGVVYTRLCGDPDNLAVVKCLSDAVELMPNAAPFLSAQLRGVAPVGVANTQAGTFRDKVIAALSLEDYCTEHGIELGSPNSNGFRYGLCKLHDDSNPSFYVDTRKQRCGCFAQHCAGYGTVSNVIDLHAALTKQSFTDALHALARDLGLWRDHTLAERQQYMREHRNG